MAATYARTAARPSGFELGAMAILFGVLLAAAAVLGVGWGLGIDEVVRLSPAAAAMAPSTAIALLLTAGAILWLQYVEARDGRTRIPARIALGVTAAIAAANLVIIASGQANGLDVLLAPEQFAGTADKMAAATAICALLSVIGAPGAIAPGRAFSGGLTTVCATVGLFLTLIALVGYAFDAPALYAVPLFTAMSMPTATAYAGVFAASLLLRRQYGWMALLLGPGRGSVSARRLFPIVVCAPFALCFLALTATREGLLSPNFRLSVLAITTVVLLGALVLRNAILENRTGRELEGTNAHLRAALDDKQLLLREVYHRVKNNLQQISALLLLEARQLGDSAARAAFAAVSGRIVTLSRVHTMLMSSDQPSSLGIGEFLSNLCAIAANRQDEPLDIRVSVAGAPRTVEVDYALSLGLLINELMAAAPARDAADGASGWVELGYVGRDDGDTLSIAFRGPGAGRAAPAGVSSQIVNALIRQLRGRIDPGPPDATTTLITLPAPV